VFGYVTHRASSAQQQQRAHEQQQQLRQQQQQPSLPHNQQEPSGYVPAKSVSRDPEALHVRVISVFSPRVLSLCSSGFFPALTPVHNSLVWCHLRWLSLTPLMQSRAKTTRMQLQLLPLLPLPLLLLLLLK
jgi:hypothetical protein